MKFLIWLATILAVQCLIPWNYAVAGDYSPILEGSICFHTGDITKSLNGSNSYFLTLGTQKRQGVFRPEALINLEFGSGTAYVNSSSLAFTFFGGSFEMGVNFYPMTIEKFQPFLGGGGVLAWNDLQIPAASGAPNTLGIAYGYEISAGMDMRFGSSDGTAFRVRTSYWMNMSNLAGLSGFELPGFKFTLGLVY